MGSKATMKSKRPSIVAIVQLPPPVNGLSIVNEAVVGLFKEHGLLAREINVAPPFRAPRGWQLVVRFLRVVYAAFALAWYRGAGARTLYLPPDGANGLALTLLLTITGRILGYRIWYHHHNFSYFDRRSFMFSLVLAWSPKRSTHIVLCERMGSMLKERYPAAFAIHPPTIIVLPNAFLMSSKAVYRRNHSTLTIGHLSNLTIEKGVLRFLDLFSKLRADNLDIEAVLAGPIANDAIRNIINESVIANQGKLRWLGPLYGHDKEDFYGNIDVFIFPSTYTNEAQPLVLLEALAAGCAILAIDRGCVTCDHSASPGAIFPSDKFDLDAFSWIKDLISMRNERHELPRRSMEAFAYAKKLADEALAEVLNRLKIDHEGGDPS